MNAKIKVFAIRVEMTIYLLLYNLHDYSFKTFLRGNNKTFMASRLPRGVFNLVGKFFPSLL